MSEGAETAPKGPPLPMSAPLAAIGALAAIGFELASGYYANNEAFHLFAVFAALVALAAAFVCGFQLLARLDRPKSLPIPCGLILLSLILIGNCPGSQQQGVVIALGPHPPILAEASALMAYAAGGKKGPAPATPAIAAGNFSQIEAFPTHVRLRKLSYNAGGDFVGVVIAAPGYTVPKGSPLGDGIFWVLEEYGARVGVAPVTSR